MGKIQGLTKLLDYLEYKNYPMTEEKIKKLLSERSIPHSRPYGDLILFDQGHIDWWIDTQRKMDGFTTDKLP